jgi:hypothetical protein
MSKHPAHGFAATVTNAAEELRQYMAPDGELPWSLTGDDHRDLLPRLRRAVSDLSQCVEIIADATADATVKEMLKDSVLDMWSGCDHIEHSEWLMEEPGDQTGQDVTIGESAAALAVSSFPQPVIHHSLQVPSGDGTQAPSPAAKSRPGSAPARKGRTSS